MSKGVGGRIDEWTIVGWEQEWVETGMEGGGGGWMGSSRNGGKWIGGSRDGGRGENG